MMWRKNEEAKPSSPGSNASDATSAPAKQNQTAISSLSTQASAQPSTTPATAAAPAAATTPAPAATAPVAAPAPAPTAISSSTIGAGLKIRGDISGNSNLIIEGDVQGKVQMINGRVTVGPTGRVHADIEALEISIDGNVQGNLKATESVRLGAHSHVQGSILTRRIAIDDGARLRGKVEMIRANDSANPSITAPSEENSKSSAGPRAAAAAGSQGS